MEIVHYLSAQVSKRVFYHSKLGLVCCGDTIKNYSDFDLHNVIAVGVCHSELPLQAHRFYPAGEKLSLSQFLADFWSWHHKSPFHGVGDVYGSPDKLVIDRKMKDGIQPSFFDWLLKAGVQVEFSEGKNRQFTARNRYVQSRPWYTGVCDIRPYENKSDSFEERYPLTFEAINSELSLNISRFGIEKYPPGKREILANQFPVGHSRISFSTTPGGVDFTPNIHQLAYPSKNDVMAKNAIWYPSEPQYQRFGFLKINDFDVETESGLELPSASIFRQSDSEDEQVSLLDQVLYDQVSGRPVNKWIVSLGNTTNGWWGEGYVVHTGTPSFICSWGELNLHEGQAMGAFVKTGEDRCIAVGFAQSLSNQNLYSSEHYPNLLHQAAAAVIEFLTNEK